MSCVGMDVASEGFTAAVYDGARVTATRRFDTREEWVDEFLRWCREHGVDPRADWVVVENTGMYSLIICYALHAQQVRLSVVSPCQLAQRFRLSKTDALDAGRLAEYGHRYGDCLQAWEPEPVRVVWMAQKLRLRQRLQRMIGELNSFLGSVGMHPVRDGSVVSRTEQMLCLLRQQLAELDEEIRAFVSEEPAWVAGCEVVRSVPGVGEQLSWQMVVWTGGFRRVPEAKRLSSWLGMAPHCYESGRRVWRGSHSRGYGDSWGRRLLWLCALASIRSDAWMKAYYARKRAEGKSARVVLNAVANKLLRRICACLREGRMYEPIRGAA